MDRTERTGLGIAAAGHLALFAVLSLGLFAAKTRLPVTADPVEVSFVDDIGLKSAAPQATAEKPAQSVAPEIGAPVEAPPPPQPKAAAPAARPEPPKPKPAPALKPAKPEPQADQRERRRPDRSLADVMKGISGVARSDAKPKGARLGSDFLKGLSAEKSDGKATKPQAAAVSAQAMAGLAAAIAAQIKPCYTVPAGGTDSEKIVTVLRLRFNRDGSVATAPAVVDHGGITADNGGYVRQMDDAARRAVLRCAPLRLPAQLYDNGWEDLEFTFRPQAMD